MQIGKHFSCLLIVIVLASSVNALTKVANDPSRISVGARILGMGKSFVGDADDIGSLFINPAGLASVSSMQFTSMSGKFINEVNYINVGTAVPSPWGTFGIGYISSDIGFTGISATTEVIDGTRIIPSGSTGSNFSYNNSALLMDFGKSFDSLGVFKNISAGATLKLFAQSLSGPTIYGSKATGLDMDIGIKYNPYPALGLGVVVQNALPFSMGGKIHWTDGIEEALPSVIKTGVSFNLLGERGFRQWGNQEVFLNLDGDFTPLRPNLPSLVHAGLEWTPIKFLSLRTGIDQDIVGKGGGALEVSNNFTAGVGLLFNEFRFDYAYHQYYSLVENDTNYFSISYGFAKKKPEPPSSNFFLISDPQDKNIVYLDTIKVAGELLRSEIKRVTVNGIDATISDHKFELSIPLLLGKNALNVEVINADGRVVESKKIRILRLTTFTDIDENYWAKDAVLRLGTLGIVAGAPDGKFKPYENIDRAKMLAIIVRIEGVSPEAITKPPFKDISPKFWALRDILTGRKMNYIKGYPDLTYKPRKNINRAEGVVVLARYAGLDLFQPVYESPFPDIPGRHWAIKAINAANNAGMLKYLEGKPFEPARQMIRGEAAQLLSTIPFISKKIDALMDWESGY